MDVTAFLRTLACALTVALGVLILNVADAGAAATARTCRHPHFVTTDPNGMWSKGTYIVHNNMWNIAGYDVSEKLSACSPGNWSVRAAADNSSGDGAVKTYPNVHRDFHNWTTGHEPRISSFHTITTTFAARSPRSGIYDTAFDIWLNGVASKGSTELMIWTHNHEQTPAGSVVARGLRFAHRTWKLWATDDHGYLAFVPGRPLNHGTIHLKARLSYLKRHKYLPAGSTLGQVDFGIEFVAARRSDPFKVDRFNIQVSRR
jgi:hypothetical protein